MEPDWLGVELRHLAALEAVAEERSFARAATRLGYTQSAVSQQIAALERAVGGRLVERPGGPRPVRATESGEVLLAHARAITARLRAARADLAALQEGARGRVRLGGFQSANARILPPLLGRLAVGAPGIELDCTPEFADSALVDQVLDGRLDLAITVWPLPEGPLAHLHLMRDPCMLVVPAGSPLAGRGRAGLEDVDGLPVVAFRTCAHQVWMEQTLAGMGHPLDVVRRTDENAALQRMVADGTGVAVVPLMAVNLHDPDVAVVPFGPAMPPRQVVVVWHRDRELGPGARRVVDVAAEVCAEIELSLAVPGGQAGAGAGAG